MITDTKVRILSYIRTNGQARVKYLAEHLGIGTVALHRQLKSLVESGKLIKAGSVPKVFYTLASPSPENIDTVAHEASQLLDNYFAYVDPTGQFVTGIAGFRIWLTNVNKSDQETSLLARYVKDRKELHTLFSPQGWIDASQEISPIIIPYLREYEDKVAQAAEQTVRQFIREGKYDAAVKLADRVIAQDVDLVWTATATPSGSQKN